MDYLKRHYGGSNISMDELHEELKKFCCVAQINCVLGQVNRNITNLAKKKLINRKIYPDL